ncbi:MULTISPECIES: ABC transporter substrate-binding protein [Streptomyces]|uniref:Sugar ABC transporter substrate-binding protein n=1 Tax=Streptomyces arboris TaxID=2600619 RepID=A0A5N5EFT7_9ACTN|nr:MULTISPECIES: sugar ABC transporter substrate-binding protein [Streptomyces]KAB2589575.1 sugar ABC transporter substrate-binding protein [Streptomyces arboris]MDX3378722.1 sugar ABC transporter substrate-binding protein [Streptomyces sp. ME02-6991-2A]MZF55155.1 extracellular solute-binding protein [Streptomyces sp. SID5594]NDZ63057.1 sugar ABC transporter substrate-binding protein [Streptomyces cyaneofuscatus]PVC82081.1 sugar ABC transporter substrate-binding protein [Streptomyces sp. CS090
MRSSVLRRTCTAAVATALAVTGLAACNSEGESAADGKTRITVNCWPQPSAKIDHQRFDEDVKTFEKQNPDIDITAHDAFPCQDPKTFDAKLAGGQMEDVFYTYFTDTERVVSINQAADITEYVKDLKAYKDIAQPLRDAYTVDGKIYGVPRTNYSMGLLYSKALFTKAGLDPEKPPATWPEVQAAAKKIAGLGNGTVGFAEYSAQNQGGWHFTAHIYSQGGSVVSEDGKKATVDTPEGKAVLQNLKDMRWRDNSMGAKQLLIINDTLQMMGSGKLGMYLAAPDNVPRIVKEAGGKYEDLAFAPMPGGKGTLMGGDGYMFNKKATPEQIKAGLKWLEWTFLTPGQGYMNNYARAAEDKSPVGLPEPRLFTGATDAKDQELKKASANVPVENYQAFIDGGQQLDMKLEPKHGQQIYAVLDGAVSAVLTKKDADIDQLLKDAQSKIDGILTRG